MQQYDVKITVVKKLSTEDVYGIERPKCSSEFETICTRLRVGDSFLSKAGSFPDGFCSWAFADIQRDITHLRFGGDYPLMDEGVAYACCTDGLRPVFFKLERVK